MNIFNRKKDYSASIRVMNSWIKEYRQEILDNINAINDLNKVIKDLEIEQNSKEVEK